MAKYKDQYNYVNPTLDASKIKFLSGTQTQLNKYLLDSGDDLSGKAQEGAFYLTSDTHRLYIGRAITVNSSTKIIPVPVNEGIETVSSISALPTNANQGEFYYIAPYTENGEQKGNILAVRSGGNWVQLNTDTHIGGVASSVVTHTDSSNNITDIDVKTTITDSNGNIYGNGPLEQWKLVRGDNVIFSYTPAVTTAGSEASARLTIAAIDTKYTVGTATSASDGEIKITPSGNANASASSVHLTSKTTNSANQSKNGDLTITSDNSGNVTFDLKEVEGVSVSNRTGNATGFKIAPVIDGTARVDGNDGDVLDPTIQIGASLGLQQGETLSSVSGGAENVKFSNGIAELDVYTRLQTEKRIEDVVNQKIQVADALTYIGTASYSNNSWSYTDGLNNNVTAFHKGDTFKVNSIVGNPQISGVNVKVGDLLIANGSENDDGVITSQSLSWNLIPSGDEPTYSVTQNTTNKTTTFQSTINSNTESIGSISYAADDDWISSALTQESAGSPNATITYSHKTKNFTSDTNTSDNTTLSYTGADTGDTLTFLALDTSTPLTLDKGHVTGIKGKQVSVTLNKLDKVYSMGSSYTTAELGTGANALLSGAKINLKIKDKKSTSPIDLTDKEIRYTSKTLAFSGSTGGDSNNDSLYAIVNVDLQWGAF